MTSTSVHVEGHKLPWAFTDQAAFMAANVLNCLQAVRALQFCIELAEALRLTRARVLFGADEVSC